MAGAGRMTAIARHWGSIFKPDGEAWVRGFSCRTSDCVEAPTLMPLISVPSQVLSGRQDDNALDSLVEVGSKVPNVA